MAEVAEIIPPVVRMRKPRVKKAEVKEKEDEPALAIDTIPAGAPPDPVEAQPPPPEGPAETAVQPISQPEVLLRKKRGPYKPRKPKEEQANTKSEGDTINQTEVRASGGAEPQKGGGGIVDLNYWAGLDQTVKALRRQAKNDKFSAFVIA